MDSINNACKLGSDAWLELQAFKTRQLNRREKLNRHKNLHKDLINGITSQPQTQSHASSSSSSSAASTSLNATGNAPTMSQNPTSTRTLPDQSSRTNSSTSHNTTNSISVECGGSGSLSGQCNSNFCDFINSNATINNNNVIDRFAPINQSTLRTGDPNTEASTSSNQLATDQHINVELVECLLLLRLCDVALKLPIDSKSLQRSISRIRGLENTPLALIENLLQKFAHQELVTIEEQAPTLASRRKKQLLGQNEAHSEDESCIYVKSADHTKLVDFDKSYSSREDIQALLLESKSDDTTSDDHDSVPIQSVRTSTSSSTTSSQVHDKEDASSRDNFDSSKVARFQGDSKETKLSSMHNKTASKESTKKRQAGDDLESLLSLSSTKERESKKLGEELLELLGKPTAKERNLLERFRSADGYQVQEFCPKGTKGECTRNNNGAGHCDKLHFKKIIAKHTEESLGDCSFLNTCFHMDSCKYVHYEVDYGERPPQQHPFKRPITVESSQKQHKNQMNPSSSSSNNANLNPKDSNNSSSSKSTLAASTSFSGPFQYKLSPEEQARIDAKNRKRFKTVLYPPQWIQCDLRFFDMSLLGKFSVVMADPPWDIHMELPYGTMSDDEMRKLNIPALQDEGVIFLWVTGRAMELGRECLALWGYERCDEIIWVKTNQLQRIIRTGRTGHWLNHGKEHCLVGVKGKPKDMNRGLDCDVIVAEVRATSHKPDEIYGIIERLSPGTRKIELFGRAHNVQPNWITLGNQLNGVQLIEPNLINAFKKLNLPFQTAEGC